MKLKCCLNSEDFPFQIAAFIAEPVMGAGGVIPPPATYFDKVGDQFSLIDVWSYKVQNKILHGSDSVT